MIAALAASAAATMPLKPVAVEPPVPDIVARELRTSVAFVPTDAIAPLHDALGIKADSFDSDAGRPKQQASGKPSVPDASTADALRVLVSVIPTDAIALFTATTGLAEVIAMSMGASPGWLLAAVFAVVLVLAVAAYVAKTATDANNDGRQFEWNPYVRWHLFAIPFAFTLWAFAMSQSTFLALAGFFGYHPESPDFSHPDSNWVHGEPELGTRRKMPASWQAFRSCQTEPTLRAESGHQLSVDAPCAPKPS